MRTERSNPNNTMAQEFEMGPNEVAKLAQKLAAYVTYETPEKYSGETVLNDVLYFIGTSIDPKKFEAAQGFRRFKELLREVIK